MTTEQIQNDICHYVASIVYRELKAKVSDGGRRVTLEFSKLPYDWTLLIPGPVELLEEKEPATINLLDLIKRDLPGFWGYANVNGASRLEICRRCRKTFDKKGNEVIP